MRGKPYIGEYLDETTGYWLKGDQERSRYYNHSTFCDLIITGIVGLRPRADQTIEVRPIIQLANGSTSVLTRCVIMVTTSPSSTTRTVPAIMWARVCRYGLMESWLGSVIRSANS